VTEPVPGGLAPITPIPLLNEFNNIKKPLDVHSRCAAGGPEPVPFTNPAEGAPGPSLLGTGESQSPDIEIVSSQDHALLATVPAAPS